MPLQRLTTARSKCTGCRFCETACTVSHEGQALLINARISIVSQRVEDQTFTINVCRLCKQCPPLDVCPTGALYREDGTGIIRIHGALCPAGCDLCVEACDLDAIFLGLDKVIVCDLCGGDPVCVKFCETEALTLHTFEPKWLR